MSWVNILKKEEDREGLEIELEQLIDRWGNQKDLGDWAWMSEEYTGELMGLGRFHLIEVDVTFEDMYEGDEDLSQEEKLEQDVGYYRIDFRTQKDEFAMGDYTYNHGFNIHEFNPEKIEINELKEIINSIR